MQTHIERYDQVDSTNSMIKRALDAGEPEGLVARALVQTGGYGRQGRSWVSLEGGSYQSILLRPERERIEWPTLTLVVGLAVRRALIELCGLEDSDIFVKWPNDVMTEKGKLVGISCEAHGTGVCVGIGVNVLRPSVQVELAGKNTAAYVEDLVSALPGTCAHYVDPSPCSQVLLEEGRASLRDAVSDAVVSKVSEYYDIWQREGLGHFLDEYRSSNGIMGRFAQLLLTDGGMLTEGRVVDIDDAGHLVIEREDGTIQAYSSGEVHIL